MDFKDTVETVRAIVTRLNSPVSSYNLVFSESDTAIEVRVETTQSLEPVFVFVVDSERFRVVKDTVLNPEGYFSYTYSSCVELLSYIFECFYPVFSRINHGISIADMLTRVFGESIRIWKDLVRVICKSGGVEFFDFGDVMSLLGTNFRYKSDSFELVISGEIEDTVKCLTVMELVVAILAFVDYLFKREELDINPILGDQIVAEGGEGFDFAGMEDTLAMGDEIDAGDPGMGGDLEAEFEPVGEGMENFAPDIAEGKEEVLDEVLG